MFTCTGESQKKKNTWKITWPAAVAPPQSTEPSDNNNKKKLLVVAIVDAVIGGVDLSVGLLAAAVIFTKRRSGKLHAIVK